MSFQAIFPIRERRPSLASESPWVFLETYYPLDLEAILSSSNTVCASMSLVGRQGPVMEDDLR